MHETGVADGKDAGNLFLVQAIRENDVPELILKAALGTGAMTLFAMLGAKWLDEDDPPFAVYGLGPFGSKRKQLMAGGWIPYSIKIGPVYLNYQETPMAVGLSIVGNYQDGLRWKDEDDKALSLRTAAAVAGSMKTITSQSFLSGMMDLLTLVDRGAATESTLKGFLNLGLRAGSNLVVPNALRQTERLFYPEVTNNDVTGVLVRQLPFVRLARKPMLNLLGEPVSSGLNRRFWTVQNNSTLAKLAAVDAWVSAPSRDSEIMSESELYELIEIRGPRLKEDLEKHVVPYIGLKSDAWVQDRTSRISRAATARARKLIGLTPGEIKRRRAAAEK